MSKFVPSTVFTRVRTFWSSIRTSASIARCASPSARSRRSISEEEIPTGQENFKELNAELAKKWPVISEKKDAPADAKQWEGVKDKVKLLER